MQKKANNAGDNKMNKKRRNSSNTENISWVIYLIPVLFGILGGTITYFALKNTAPSTAKFTFIVGIVATVLYYILLVFGAFGTLILLS